MTLTDGKNVTLTRCRNAQERNHTMQPREVGVAQAADEMK